MKPVQEANHPPLAVLNGVSGRGPVRMTAQRGERVELSSAGSEDPDGDVLTTSWTIDADAGTFQGQPRLSADQGESVVLTIPDQGQAGAIHVILTVRDSGAPPLTRYRRAIVDVQ